MRHIGYIFNRKIINSLYMRSFPLVFLMDFSKNFKNTVHPVFIFRNAHLLTGKITSFTKRQDGDVS